MRQQQLKSRHSIVEEDRKQQQQQQQQQPVDIFLTHLPANLRAKFGRSRCRELLADQAEVQRVWSRIAATACDEANSDRLEQQRRRLPQWLPPLQQQQRHHHSHQLPTTDWYAVLSEQFNSDYSPGVAATRRLGHNHETHSEAVFDQSGDYNGPNDGRHKRRKDEFNAYNEVIHMERKFNHQWARSDGGDGGGSRRTAAGESVVARRQPPAAAVATQQQQQQPQPTSILSGRGGGGSRQSGKHVTISDQNAGREVGGRGEKSFGGGSSSGQQSLHRANTIQRED